MPRNRPQCRVVPGRAVKFDNAATAPEHRGKRSLDQQAVKMRRAFCADLRGQPRLYPARLGRLGENDDEG